MALPNVSAGPFLSPFSPTTADLRRTKDGRPNTEMNPNGPILCSSLSVYSFYYYWSLHIDVERGGVYELRRAIQQLRWNGMQQ